MKPQGVSNRTALVVATALAACGPAQAQHHATTSQVPAEMELDSIETRRQAQVAAWDGVAVFHDFVFEDRLEASGITFEHKIVDDAGVNYKPVHYDHGNGVAAADVDQDGKIDLYFVSQLGGNQLWRNLGSGRFENWTQRAGVGMADRVGVAASFADIDNDGDADLFVTTVRHGNALFLNNGKGVFQDVTEKAGLSYSGHSSAAVFFDYDRDGLLDLFLCNVGRYTSDEQGRGGYYVGIDGAFSAHLDPAKDEASILYRNLGDGRFADVSAEVLLADRSWSGAATPLDADGDGFQDLYVLNMQGADHYWRNVEGKFFIDSTDRLFPRNPLGAMGIKVFDWNRDGDMDILITDMHSDMLEDVGPELEKEKARRGREGQVLQGLERRILGNALFDHRDGRFVEISDQVGVENYWPWGLSVDDLNADGWDDVFITASMNYPFRYGLNSVLLNDRGQLFRDAELLLGVEPRSGELTKPWFEIDCGEAPGEVGEGDVKQRWEGAFDGSAAGSKPTERHPDCGDKSGKVVVMGARGSRSSVILDLDHDGDLDVVTSEFNDRPQVLISNLAQKRPVRRLQVRLRGSRSNRDGLGARVTVTANGFSQTKVHDGQSGYLSQSSIPLYFGLGDATEVEHVEVTWPSGATQRVTQPNLEATLLLVEPAD